MFFGDLCQPVDEFPGLPVRLRFLCGAQAEVPFRNGDCRFSRHPAEDRGPAPVGDGSTPHLEATFTGYAIEDDPGQREFRIEELEAENDSSDTASALSCVDDEEDGQLQKLGYFSAPSGLGKPIFAVEGATMP